MPVYTIEGFDLPAVVTLADFPEVLRRVNARAALVVQREARDNAWQFRDTGALARSIQARVEDLTVTVSVPSNQPTAAYANVMELGRRPGRLPPPWRAVYGWARRHPSPYGQSVDRWVHIVANVVGRRGIEGRLYMQRAYESLLHQMPTIIDTVMHQMGLA